MAIVDIFPLDNFIDLMHRILHRDLVREIGREHAPLWEDTVQADSISPAQIILIIWTIL